jgi:hypothetical protein
MTQKELIASIDSWLAGKASPLAGYADYMVILARYHGIAVTLSLGIAQAETQCATDPHMERADLVGHNAWGYGHFPGTTHGFAFASWPDGISAVTEYLHDEYIALGLTTVEAICPKYVGSYNQNWVDAVSEIIRKFGGDPKVLARTPLERKH